MNKNDSELLTLLQALSDESRLSILRHLFQQEDTVGHLAELLKLSAPTVSHHLSCLRSAGLVHLRTDKNQHFYSVNSNGLVHFKNLIEEIEKTPVSPLLSENDLTWIQALDCSEEDRKVLREHTQNGLITHLPAKQKKMTVLLRWLASLFEKERLYTEQEVNAILKSKYQEDYVSLRRDLVDLGYLRRERGGGRYWLTPSEETKEDQ